MPRPTAAPPPKPRRYRTVSTDTDGPAALCSISGDAIGAAAAGATAHAVVAAASAATRILDDVLITRSPELWSKDESYRLQRVGPEMPPAIDLAQLECG